MVSIGVYCRNRVDRQKINTLKAKTWWLLWLLFFGVTFMWRAQNLDAFGLSNDEGAHLMWAQLAVDGYPLYAETRAVQLPLFLEGVGLALRLGGPTVQAGRWALLSGYAILALSLSWLAHRAGGKLPALLSVLLLGLAPLVFVFSRLVMAEVPATGLAVLALAFAFRFFDQGQRGWLFASGLALGGSLMIKPLNPFIAAPVGLLLFLQAGEPDYVFPVRRIRFWWVLFVNSLIWGSGVLLPAMMILSAYDLAAVYEQLILFRSDLRAAIPGSWAETWGQFLLFVDSHWAFWLLAGGGLLSAFMRSSIQKKGGAKHPLTPQEGNFRFLLPPLGGRGGLVKGPLFYPTVWLMWLVAGGAMLAWHTPLFPHHFVILLPPLILLGAGFIDDVAAFWRYPGPSVGLKRYGWPTILFLVVVGAFFNVPALIAANQKTAAIVTGGREVEALTLLQAVTGSDDFVMGDSQSLIFMAGRRTPPPLGDVALVAIKAGHQTSPRMMSLTQTYRAAAVVQWSLRLPWLPDYLAWVEANYLARRVWDNDHIIYFAPRFPGDQSPPNAQRVRLGEALMLRGYQVEETTVQAGDRLDLKVYWQTDASLSENYTIFTQLLDRNSLFVAGWDSQPLGGHFPTKQWPSGEIVTDIVRLPIPPDLLAGDYQLITGLYLLETGARLTTAGGQDYINLAPIFIID